MTSEKLEEFKKSEHPVDYHFSLGMWIRNNWGLWSGSRLSKYFNDMEVFHPDDMSSIILDSFHRYLNGQDIKLEEQVEASVKYWEELKKFEKRKIPKNVRELFEAIKKEDFEKIKTLIDKGVDVNCANKDGDLALVKAIETGRLDIVAHLVENGADVNARDIIPYRKWPILLDAVMRGNLDMVRYLVESGANITVTDDYGRTALMNAVIFKRLDIVKYLIEEKGMDIDAKNIYGHTAIVCLFNETNEEGTFEVLEYIIEKGADVNIRGASGATLLDMAIYYNDNELIQLLKSKGAKRGEIFEVID